VIRPGIGRALLFVAVFVAASAVPVSDSSGAEGGAPPPYVAAEAWYLVGGDGTLLADRGAHERRAIASITKLMTAVVTLEHARLSDVVTIAAGSSRAGESTAHLRPGEQLSVATLLQAMLVASANDAARALALHVGQGSVDRFVSLMNAKARELGLDETNFENPHGLDEQGHVSSAEDVTQLLRYALGIGFIRDALDRNSVFLPGGRELETTDDLLGSWPPLVGGKTGHTADAGWSEAAAASRRGAIVYGSVLGSDSRTERNDALRTLLAFGLDHYRRVAVIDSSRVYAELETAYDRPSVELVAPRTLVRTVHEQRSLVERVVAPSAVELPVRRGQRLGRVDVYDGKRLVASSVLVAAEAVSEPGLVGKAAWYAERTVENLWGFVT
jgi:D-alanyl-D-alanine carboxypeptidase (penicillin-binding protein 5/6)